jgi:hypothetical protein
VRIVRGPAFAHNDDAHTLRLNPRGHPRHYVSRSVNSKCWLLVDVDRPTAKLDVSGIVTFDDAPLLQLTHSLANSLRRSKLTIQLEFTYLGAHPLEDVASCLLLRGGLIAKEHIIQRVRCASTWQRSASPTRWPRPRRITKKMAPASKCAWCACRTSSLMEAAARTRNWTCSLLPVHRYLSTATCPRRETSHAARPAVVLSFACCAVDVQNVCSKAASSCTRSARRNLRFACRLSLVTACTPVPGPACHACTSACAPACTTAT